MKGNKIIKFLAAICFVITTLYERPTIAIEDTKDSNVQQQSSENTQVPQKKKIKWLSSLL